MMTRAAAPHLCCPPPGRVLGPPVTSSGAHADRALTPVTSAANCLSEGDLRQPLPVARKGFVDGTLGDEYCASCKQNTANLQTKLTKRRVSCIRTTISASIARRCFTVQATGEVHQLASF